ncbi:choice-of-anchor E domain-containing protein [Oceaniferula marina]|nr:choice-of-anchor E domain-containing protein [Oceaniferula marina]
MKQMIPMFAVSAMSLSVASAASYTVTASPNPVTGEITTLTDTPAIFASFDSSLGTLTEVRVKVTARESAHVTIENNTESAVTAQVTLNGDVSAYVDVNSNGTNDDAFGAEASLDQASGDIALEATDNGGVANNIGVDFWSDDIISAYESNESSSSLSSDLAYFVGDGISTRTAFVNAGGSWGASGASNATFQVTNHEGEAIVEVTYIYAVPEPSSFILAGLGSLAFIFRRRRS